MYLSLYSPPHGSVTLPLDQISTTKSPLTVASPAAYKVVYLGAGGVGTATTITKDEYS